MSPIVPASSDTPAEKNFLFSAQKADPGIKLPPQHLVYFVLVDLLGFRNLGRFEKLAWSVPIEYKGRAYLIEDRKFGLGIFAQDARQQQVDARQIAIKLQKAVRASAPFFDWLASEAVRSSRVNLVNNSKALRGRLLLLRRKYAEALVEVEAERVEKDVAKFIAKYEETGSFAKEQATWLGVSAVEAFFSWTEHVLIHVAVLTGKLSTALEITKLIEADWSSKFKAAIGVRDKASKILLDRLLALRSDLRNYVAHGAFGKQGEAFMFHSGAGAVPVVLPSKSGTRRFRLGDGLSFDIEAALTLIDEFENHLWSFNRAPAKAYLHESEMPLILTYAADGTYARAMESEEAMTAFIHSLVREYERAANMDW